MKTLFRHIFSYLAALLIVAATGGISMFQHYCSCHDEQQSSLFTESIHCHQMDENVCHETDEKQQKPETCCSKEQTPVDNTAHDHSGHTCCSTVYSYYKTDLVNLKEPVFVPQKFNSTVTVLFTDSRTDQEIAGSTTVFQDIPPPATPSGRELLCFLQQRKLDAPPC